MDLVDAALRRGHAVAVVDAIDLSVSGRRLMLRAHRLDGPRDDLAEALSSRALPRVQIQAGDLDWILARCSPLTDATHGWLRLARDRGVRVVNDPDGMVAAGRKSWLASLDVPTPATLVTASTAEAALFLEEASHGLVVKPVRGSGGNRVIRVLPERQDQLDAAFRHAAGRHSHVVLQQYLPGAHLGEKRLIWADGVLIGGYLRVRSPGDFRHNLKQGAQPRPAEIHPQDLEAVSALSPHLLRDGVRFAGLDLIDHQITDVNALNPGGTVQVGLQSGHRVADQIIATLERSPPNLETTPWASLVP